MRHAKNDTDELEGGADGAVEVLGPASGAAELKIVKDAETMSFTATLPRENAADLLPMVAILAAIAGPVAIFHFAHVAGIPWWVSSIVAFVHLVAVTTLAIRRRASPRPRR